MIPEGLITELVRHGGNLFSEAVRLAHRRDLVISTPLAMMRGCAALSDAEKAAARAHAAEQAGVRRLVLVAGWTKNTLPVSFYKCIKTIRDCTALEICVSFGPVHRPELIILRELGVSRVFCAFMPNGVKRSPSRENSRAAFHRTLHDARDLGLKTCAGLLIGNGEPLENVETDIRIAGDMGIDYLSIASTRSGPPVLGQETSFEQYLAGRMAAAARICLPDEIDIAVSCHTEPSPTWGMDCGANAFCVSLGLNDQDGGCNGYEVLRLKNQWREYGVRETRTRVKELSRRS